MNQMCIRDSNSAFLVRLLPALQKGSAVVFFFRSLWYTIVYFDLSFEKVDAAEQLIVIDCKTWNLIHLDN